ncbi:restriction endonuclease subunit S [Empedobacter falsenii]
MEKVKISDVFIRIKNGANIKQIPDSLGIPITRIETISNGTIDYNRFGYANILDSTKYEEYILQEGDILMSHINSLKHLAKTAIVTNSDSNNTMIHGMNLLLLRVNEDILINKYVKYYFGTEYFKSDILKISNQSVNQCSFSITGLKEIQIPLPSLAEQKAIAAKLDKAQEIIRYNEEIIAKYDALTQSLFIDMFGDPVRNEKGWEKKTLKEVCSKITDGTHDTPERLKVGVKFITGKHIKPFFIDYENSDYVTEEVHNEIYRRCNPEINDILYTNIGVNFGTAAMNIVKYEFSMKNVALLKFNRKVLTGRYLEYLLNNFQFKEKLKIQFGIGGAQQFLSLANIGKIIVSLPPISLQNQFAERVAVIEAQKQLAQESLVKSQELFSSLLQQSFED